ncbi:MAG: hypothetical protein HYR66_18755 [Sphingobacteriales bacterium]|nr:hypothetical protein [Sphingobacteriales bacterium]MBI3720363.1 hypothetical protein [Sphingobacteriales bacterium]
MEKIENVYDKLKVEYSDLIYQTEYRNPNYEEIHFNQFLEKKFKKTELFHQYPSIKAKIDMELKRIYGERFDKYKIFPERGQIANVLFVNLKYYQSCVGINGSNSSISLPVFVLKYKKETILYDGYHRALQKMVNDELGIDAFILSI